jgi:hypothetical protein
MQPPPKNITELPTGEYTVELVSLDPPIGVATVVSTSVSEAQAAAGQRSNAPCCILRVVDGDRAGEEYEDRSRVTSSYAIGSRFVATVRAGERHASLRCLPAVP